MQLARTHKIITTISVIFLAYVGYTAAWNLSQRPEEQAGSSQGKNIAPATGTQSLGRISAESELIYLVNQERKRMGRAELQLDPRIIKTAQAKARDMVKNNYYEHKNLRGVEGYLSVFNVAPECRYASENLIEADTPAEAVRGWKESKAHYKAMTAKKFDYTGFGIAKNDSGHYYVVQHLCDV